MGRLCPAWYLFIARAILVSDRMLNNISQTFYRAIAPKLPQRREEAVAKATTALADNRERVQIMEEHLKNVRQEVGHTNALMAAKKKEIATEEHLCALAAREAGRYGVVAGSCSLRLLQKSNVGCLFLGDDCFSCRANYVDQVHTCGWCKENERSLTLLGIHFHACFSYRVTVWVALSIAEVVGSHVQAPCE